jgi:hypothetical protein
MANTTTAARSADRSQITRLIAALEPTVSLGSWLSPSNCYRNSIHNMLGDSNQLHDPPPNQIEFKDFIASSGVSHCIDGWSYLSESLSAYLCGNDGISIHLAYYSELRAALSFLVSQGICVLDKKHYYIDNNGNCNRFSKDGKFKKQGGGGNGTHMITWEAINKWSEISANQSYFLSLIKVNSLTLDDWISEILQNPNSRSHINKRTSAFWLQQWTQDIFQHKNLTNDRTIRNKVSYQPSFNDNPIPSDAVDRLKNVLEIIKTLEPIGMGSLKKFDSILLKSAIHSAASLLSLSDPEIEKRLTTIFYSNNITDQSLFSFLTSNSNEFILDQSRQTIRSNHSTNPIPMICRALLLLRMSTAACEMHLSAAISNRSSLESWRNSIIDQLGLGEANSISDVADLWQDKELAIEEIASFTKRNSSSSVYNLFNNIGNWLHVLKQAQVASLWGLRL